MTVTGVQPRLTRRRPASPLAPRRSAWRLLRQPGFRRYFAGSVLSNLGTWTQNTAQVLLAYQLTHSVFMVGVVTCAQFSGFLVLGPWAAVIAGRLGGKRMLIATQAASAVIAGGMAALQAAGTLTEYGLLAGALLLGLAFTLALPVQTALVPRLVGPDDTEAAMAMNSVSYNLGRAVAPLVCVAVVMATGFTAAFALNCVSFAVYALLLSRVRPRTVPRVRQRVRARDGVLVAMGRPRIALLLAMVAAVTFADDPVLVLGPAMSHQMLHVSHDWAAYFLSALGFGTVLGSVRPTREHRAGDDSHSSRRAAGYLLVLVAAIFLWATGLSPWLCLLAAYGAGVAALRTGAATQTQLVRQRPEHAASVMALWAVAWAGTKPLASLLDGSLASVAGVRWASVTLALPALALGVTELCLSPSRKRKVKDWARAWAKRHDHSLLPFALASAEEHLVAGTTSPAMPG